MEEKSKEAATNRNHCVLNANTSNTPPLPFFVPLKAPSVTCRDTNGVGGVSDEVSLVKTSVFLLNVLMLFLVLVFVS